MSTDMRVPSPYLAQGLHGLDTNFLDTDHFHHQYNFWCVTKTEGRLVLNAKTVHGNQLIPDDLKSVELMIDKRFAFSKEVAAVQLDIHETVQRKKLVTFDASDVEQILSDMRRNIKGAFLLATTKEAHEKWKLKANK